MNNLADYQEKDRWDIPAIGRPLIELLTETLEIKEEIHPWIPAGLTLLAGKTKSGKSTLAEQIAEEISLHKKVLYLALEYNMRMAQSRFQRFGAEHQIHIILEGEIKRMGKGGEEQFEDLLFKYKPKLVIIDILAKIKRHNTGMYDAEYQAMTEIKELVGKYDVNCLVLTHSGKPNANDSDDPFDKIIGSRALQGVPDNLMLLVHSSGQTKLHTKGRSIYPSEKILTFENGKYSQRSSIGAEYEDKAPVQAMVLKALKDGPMTVSHLATLLGKDKGQISNVCSSLSDLREITRANLKAPWSLVTADELT